MQLTRILFLWFSLGMSLSEVSYSAMRLPPTGKLISAVKDGDQETIQALISQAREAGERAVIAYINSTDERGATALLSARRPDIIDLLIAHGAKLDAVDRSGDNLLMLLTRAGHANAVERVVQVHIIPECRELANLVRDDFSESKQAHAKRRIVENLALLNKALACGNREIREHLNKASLELITIQAKVAYVPPCVAISFCASDAAATRRALAKTLILSVSALAGIGVVEHPRGSTLAIVNWIDSSAKPHAVETCLHEVQEVENQGRNNGSSDSSRDQVCFQISPTTSPKVSPQGLGDGDWSSTDSSLVNSSSSSSNGDAEESA